MAGDELAARSVPAEEVGGDFYDFHPFADDLMGLAIGDASGHGLPAALLVRDVVTGLRVGFERELKIASVMAKLNRVIHKSALSSRFVSVFYGELEGTGSLIYVNAGHPPPQIFSGERIVSLDIGGTVVGALPDVQFRRGVAHLDPGDVLVMCTDGILERRGKGGELGNDGVREVVRAHRGASAQELLEALFAAAEDHGAGRPWEDDASAVVVRRSPR
jgi:sigma-B regulation protein RsbU (phosphoserine phosphatase)